MNWIVLLEKARKNGHSNNGKQVKMGVQPNQINGPLNAWDRLMVNCSIED